MAYNAKRVAELLLKVPEDSEVSGWDDEGIYILIEKEQYYISDEYEVIKCYSGGEIKYDLQLSS